MYRSLQGPSVEVVVGAGDKTASWTIPVALLTKHAEYFRTPLSDTAHQGTPAVKKHTLADRSASIFQIFVQWMYFNTIPTRYDMSRTSTGESLSNIFQLWTLGDFLKADEFKNRIMSDLYIMFSLQLQIDGFRFTELNAAEVEYCWSQTTDGSKLRIFILDILSHHITFGDYIHIGVDDEWQKLFTTHADLQLRVLAHIAASSNTFSSLVSEIPALTTYLETIKIEGLDALDE